MTTGPLTNCDPNDWTEAFPLPEKLYLNIGIAAIHVFACLSYKFGVQLINKYLNFLGIWMLSDTS